MAPELTHVELEELLGAYALDAVSPEEADAVDRHLRECPRCREEVALHREVAASLAQVGSVAPEGVWQRIADSLEEPPPQLDLARVTALRPTRRTPAAAWRIAAASVAAMSVGIIGILGAKLVDQDHRLENLTAAVEGRSLERTAVAALVDGDARRVALRSLDERLKGEAVVLPDGSGYLVRSNLPTLPSDRTYQLWALVGDAKISLGVLGPKAAVTAFRADTDLRALAVTEEPAGGVAATENPPVMLGFVPEAEAGTRST